MSELFSNWPAMDYGEKMITHLRSRTMPGLPHIGVIGPTPPESDEDTPVSVDDTDMQRTESLSDVEEDELDWSFVPNKVRYHMTIKPTSENRNVTKIEFYIRLREGSDGDIGKDLLEKGRYREYLLNPKDLENVFRHYELFINTENDVAKTTATLFVDENERKIQSEDFNFHDNQVSITIRDQSDPFLNYNRSVPVLVRQDYEILISKEVKNNEDGTRNITVTVDNQSLKTKRSTIPTIDIGESEEDARKKIAARSKKIDLIQDPLWPEWRPNLYKVKNARNNTEGNRYGYLMEFIATENISSFIDPIQQKDLARITNLVFDYKNLNTDGKYEGEIIFRDHAIFVEKVPKMKEGSPSMDKLSKLKVHEELGKVLQEDLGYNTLHRFQEDSIEKILDARNNREKDTVLISARTAGGKTESFLVPIIDTCLKTENTGTKAIIFYPTKALANDQASRFIKILYHLNKRISGRKITLGILHGDISKAAETLAESEVKGMPFECPKCERGHLMPIDPEHMECDNEECKIKIDFVWAHSRMQIYANPPDILITNPDTIIWDLMVKPEHHSIFGKQVFACQDCGMTYAPSGNKISCNGTNGCQGKNLEKITSVSPSFIVFDEIHLFKGSFGINCSYVLSRIENTIRHYAEKYHSNPNHEITRVGSTATISNDKEFVEKFFNVKEGKYWLIPENKKDIQEYYSFEKNDDSFNRIHVFVMPYAYTSDSTVGMAIQYLESHAKYGTPPTRLEEASGGMDKYLQILTFVNAIKTSNSLISQTRRTVAGELPDLQVDGHTTDFDRIQRAKVEKKFNVGDLHVVFATSTLEVGVDFRNVHCVVINGFPYSFNDYLQRIGRGGRKNDSIILTVCQNWKPVDHYYYVHGKRALEKQYENIEPVPITRENSEAIKKHVQGALFDYIVRNKDEGIFDIEDIRTFKQIENNREAINDDVMASCSIPKSLQEGAILHLDEFANYLTQIGKSTGISGKPKTLQRRFWSEINPKFNLTSLRSTDPEVTIEVFWNK